MPIDLEKSVNALLDWDEEQRQTDEATKAGCTVKDRGDGTSVVELEQRFIDAWKARQ